MKINLHFVGVIILTWLSILDVAKTSTSSKRPTASKKPSGSPSRRNPQPSSKKVNEAPSSSSSSIPMKLEHISVLFAHGVEAPTSKKTLVNIFGLGYDSSYWKPTKMPGFDNFLEHSYKQMQKLGNYMYRKYKNTLKLSSIRPETNSEVLAGNELRKIREVSAASSDAEITILSAKGVVEGLVGKNVDTKFISTNNLDKTSLKECPLLEKETKKDKTEKFMELSKKYAKLTTYFNSEILPTGNFKRGERIEKLQDLFTICDTTLRELSSGLESHHQSNVQDVYDDFIKFYSDYLEIWKTADSQIVNQLRIGRMLNLTIDDIKNVLAIPSSSSSASIPKVHLYSTYDTTIIALLKALRVSSTNGIYQKYGTYPVLPGGAVTLELYSQKNGHDKEYFVQVVYNKETKDYRNAEQLLVEGCGTTMCPLQTFLNQVGGLTLNAEQFHQKCNES